MESKRKDVDPVRQAELAAYFTHCNLQQVHLLLCLRSAMNCAYKIKNFQTAGSFARRLLELEPKNDVAEQVGCRFLSAFDTYKARKVVRQAEENKNENSNELNYNDRNPFVVCGISFTPIYKGNPQVNCSYCQAAFLPSYKGKLCPTCQVAQIGKESAGLQLFANPKSKD
jgi:coatomer protein complex subunit alpha (xenin)